MIYTVTLNPSLDYIVEIPELKTGQMNRTTNEIIVPGGKGINVTYALKELDCESIASGFIAGRTGKMLLDMLHQNFIQTDFIDVYGGMTRINIKVQGKEETEINGSGPKVTKEELEIVKSRISSLTERDTLIVSGSLPNGVPSDFYYEFIECANEKGCTCILDASGEAFKKAVEACPFLVKPNRTELSELFDKDIRSFSEVLYYARRLQSMGPKNVLVSLGKDGAVLLCEDGTVYRGNVPEVNGSSIGAGDSMVAGFVNAMKKNADMHEAFLQSLIMGTATASVKGIANQFEIEKIKGQITVERIMC